MVPYYAELGYTQLWKQCRSRSAGFLEASWSGSSLFSTHIWASTRENLSLGFVNNTGTDQPAHPCRLISTFVIRYLKSIIFKLATGEISIFQLVSIAEEAGLRHSLSKTPEVRFSHNEAHIVERFNDWNVICSITTNVSKLSNIIKFYSESIRLIVTMLKTFLVQ